MIAAIDRDFVSALCLARAGLKVDPDKSYLIESRLAPLVRREGYPTLEVLIGAVREGEDDRLAWSLVEAMALAESEFFRDRGVFERLVGEVLPALAHDVEGPVRIWSAACGAGQEIYSLAMLLADAPSLAGRVELYASDLSERNLEKAQAGLYSQFEVQRGLPARLLVRHFEKRGEAFALAPRIRHMVRWRRANLMDDLSRHGQFELVLCRNVLSQMAPEAHGRVRNQLAGVLAPGGRLVIGLGETLGAPFACVTRDLGLHARSGGDAARAAAA
ncbi:MAG: CheR family methyltransferase [Pseudomonadota bacterium]|jgi:chemotaxis protein methyltransferase CheR